MAEQQPMWETNLCYTAGEFRRFTEGLVCTEGVGGAFPNLPGYGNNPSLFFPNTLSYYTGSLAVSTGGAALDLVVAAGSAFIQGDNTTDQGMYWVENDASVTLTVSAASASDPRIDRVVATVRDTDFGGGGDDWVLQVVTGTPTTGANLANLNGSAAEPDDSITLAYVLIPALFAGPFVNATHIKDARQAYGMCQSSQPRVTLMIDSDGIGLIASPYTFTKANYPWLTHVRVRVWGAGGGGGGGNGGVANGVSRGGGGGGGAYAETIFSVGELSATTTCTAGAGGSAGSATGGNGGTGGTSTFGTLISCPGGGGGSGMTPATNQNSSATGGNGSITGLGSRPGYVAEGGDGNAGIVTASSESGTQRGFANRPNGGNAGGGGGGGGRGGEGGSGASAGGFPGGGGGGGGATSGNPGQTGGVGASGAIVLELFG